MNRSFILKNINLTAIIVFLFLYIILVTIKPGLMFTKEGHIRDFGIGYKNKTVTPVWLITIILAIISYLLLHVFILYPKIKF
jgi:hypothetical protein